MMNEQIDGRMHRWTGGRADRWENGPNRWAHRLAGGLTGRRAVLCGDREIDRSAVGQVGKRGAVSYTGGWVGGLCADQKEMAGTV